MWILAHRRPAVFGHASQDTNQTMQTAHVMILFQNLVTAVRRNVADPYQLGSIERSINLSFPRESLLDDRQQKGQQNSSDREQNESHPAFVGPPLRFHGSLRINQPHLMLKRLGDFGRPTLRRGFTEALTASAYRTDCAPARPKREVGDTLLTTSCPLSMKARIYTELFEAGWHERRDS